MGLFEKLFRIRKPLVRREKRVPVRVIETKQLMEPAEMPEEIIGEPETMEHDVQNLLKDINDRINRIQEMEEKLEESVEGSRKSIEDRVHTEGVKIYRNVQAVLVDLEKKIATQEQMNREMQTLKNYLKGLMGISVITMFVLVIFIMFSMGVF